MNILILTTRFPPDTAIASVRPYMFAKYLTRSGHQVTVVRSGEITSKADSTYPTKELGFKVYSYYGDNAPAERFERGEKINVLPSKSRIDFLPYRVRKICSKAFHTLNSPKEFSHIFKDARDRFEKQKILLSEIRETGTTFDIVFATFGGLENVYAGEYASKLFQCKYILDLRDPIAQRESHNLFGYKILKVLQRKAILASDVCTMVSDCAADDIRNYIPEKKIITLYNGYEPIEPSESKLESVDVADILSFCYTGQLYAGKSDASVLFRAVSELDSEGKIIKENICVFYAGHNGTSLLEQANQFGLKNRVKCLGYLGRREIQELQENCDIFLVLSWNTKRDHGLISGKFYEGIRCKKPILSIISGNEMNSELKGMNEKYHYGFCYEEANDSVDYRKLKEWILCAYQNKISGQTIPYHADDSFSSDFRYDTLSKQLEAIMLSLLSKDGE